MPYWAWFVLSWSAGFLTGAWLLEKWRQRGLRHRRGGYVKPRVSTSTNLPTGTFTISRTGADSSSWLHPGAMLVVADCPPMQPPPSRPTGRGFSTATPDEDGGATGLRPRDSAGSASIQGTPLRADPSSALAAHRADDEALVQSGGGAQGTSPVPAPGADLLARGRAVAADSWNRNHAVGDYRKEA